MPCCRKRGRVSASDVELVEPSANISSRAPGPQDRESTVAMHAEVSRMALEEMIFPMCVVRVDRFLDMREARPHQVLKREGVVIEFKIGEHSVVVFVSHEWCGRRHADPEFQQLSVLQKVFRRAAAKQLLVEHDLVSTVLYAKKASIRPGELHDCLNWFMWYDYFSVPQPAALEESEASRSVTELEMSQAISSLHAYVALSKYFLVLAPVTKHENGHLVNYRSWKSRGWCRFERLAHVMTSTVGVTVLLCESEDRLVEMGAQDFLFDPVGRGNFSVQSDRERLGPSAARFLARRLRALLVSGDTRGYIRLMSASPRLMEGLSTHVPHISDVVQAQPDLGPSDNFLKMMHLKQPAARVHGTWPLLLATRMGDLGAMDDLLHRRADIACTEARDDAVLRVFKGTSAAHVAAENGHVAALALLVEHRADLHANHARGLTPLHMMAFGGSSTCAEVGEFLLHHRADMNARSEVGATPLIMAAIYNQAQAIELLLSHGANVACADDGQNALHLAMVGGSCPKVVSLLLEAGVSTSDRVNPRGQLWHVMNFLCLAYRLGRRGLATRFGYHIWGATPLMFAAMFCDTEAATMLLRARADPEARNLRGATACTIAEAFGASEHVSKLFTSLFDRDAVEVTDIDCMP